MKKALSIVLLIAFVVSALSLVSCSVIAEYDLEYELSGTYHAFFVVGVKNPLIKNLKIPATHDGIPVIGIDKEAFIGCINLTTVEIPEGIQYIRSGAFANCKKLTSVTIADTEISIGDVAFSGCENLNDITLPDSITHIGESAFYNTAYYNNSDNWSNDVLYIGNHLIMAKDQISGAYSIKEGTKTIASKAFWGCSELQSIEIPNSVTYINAFAFAGCTGIADIVIPENVVKVDISAFYQCNNLNTIQYKGSKEQWEKIAVMTNMEGQISIGREVTIVCSDGIAGQ